MFAGPGVVSAGQTGDNIMRAHRILATGLATLLLVGTTTAADQADAATNARSTARTSTSSTVSTYRVVRAAQVRHHATGASTLTKITTAVRRSEFTAGVPSSQYAVTGLRTSGTWATVTLAPRKQAELDPATVLLRQSQGRWSVVDLGTAEVGCGVAPAATLRALKLGCD